MKNQSSSKKKKCALLTEFSKNIVKNTNHFVEKNHFAEKTENWKRKEDL